MSDPAATISLLHQTATHELGDISYNGHTKIKGVENNPLERTSQIMKFNLNTSFKDKWEDKEINAAVLDEITQIQYEDLTAPIKKVLQCLREHEPQLMKQFGHLLKLENL